MFLLIPIIVAAIFGGAIIYSIWMHSSSNRDNSAGGAWYFGQIEDRAKMVARRRAAARKTFCNEPLHDHMMHTHATEIGSEPFDPTATSYTEYNSLIMPSDD